MGPVTNTFTQRICATAGLMAMMAMVAMAAPAAAQSVSATYPDSIVRALQGNGYRARLTTDSQGDPLIESGTGGVDFHIVFYGCDDAGANCQDILFRSGFSMNEPFTLTSANSWNEAKLVGKVYVDEEQDPILLHFVAGVDGMSADSFRRLLTRWEVALDEFTDYIDW